MQSTDSSSELDDDSTLTSSPGQTCDGIDRPPVFIPKDGCMSSFTGHNAKCSICRLLPLFRAGEKSINTSPVSSSSCFTTRRD
nr:hypothetical protein Itr_chr04CG02630 [Ipomoea trifida]